MQIVTSYEDISVAGRTMRTFVAAPNNDRQYPGVVFYSDIFQLTESTLRWVSRLASYGFVVAAPEIYFRVEEPGEVFAFDDKGKTRGQADVEKLTAEQFDEDIAALLAWLETNDRVEPGKLAATGHCTGGHIGFRAALNDNVVTTALWYPTGLHDGKLGADADAGSLEQAGDIHGTMLLIFGTNDPHTPKSDREIVRAGLEESDVNFEWIEIEAEHAFGRDVGPRWDPSATDEAFAATVEFLKRSLG